MLWANFRSLSIHESVIAAGDRYYTRVLSNPRERVHDVGILQEQAYIHTWKQLGRENTEMKGGRKKLYSMLVNGQRMEANSGLA